MRRELFKFTDATHGETRGMIVADPNTYGADKLWCMLKPIPIELDNSDDESDRPSSRPRTTRINEEKICCFHVVCACVTCVCGHTWVAVRRW